MLNHVFTTPVLRDTTTLTPEQLVEIRDYVLRLRETAEGDAKSNRGGWHSKGNLFAPEHQQFPGLRGAVTAAMFNYIAEVFGFRGEIQLALTGWTVINRQGDYNVPHNHAANLLSGALYIVVPEEMKNGNIVFQDPRLNLNAHETEGMRRVGLRAPWMNTNITVPPVAGEILVFPSWLNHYVEPFESPDPNAIRIVISFNATVI
jgi:uncharacterized protein (TIGR02466 family)